MSVKLRCFLSFCLITLVLSTNPSQAQTITHPRYKMIFVNTSQLPFKPETDILNPTASELAVDNVRKNIMGASLKAAMPFVTSALSGGVSNVNMQDQLMLFTSNLRKEIFDTLQASTLSTGLLPYNHGFLLIPTLEQSEDLFYGSEKISMSATDVVNVLGFSPTVKNFDSKLTQGLKAALGQEMFSLPGSQLLAARSDITISSTSQANIKVQLVVKLDSLTTPFLEKNEKVEFKQLVIPSVQGTPSVAILTFDIDVNANPKNPTLQVELGGFDKYENGQFLISNQNRADLVPRLEGNANKKGLKWVAIKIGFESLKFDLNQLQLTSLNTITRPGLQIGKSAFVVGGFHIDSVDTEFKNEVNKKIDAEVQTAINKGQEAIDSGLVTKKVIETILSSVLK